MAKATTQESAKKKAMELVKHYQKACPDDERIKIPSGVAKKQIRSQVQMRISAGVTAVKNG